MSKILWLLALAVVYSEIIWYMRWDRNGKYGNAKKMQELFGASIFFSSPLGLFSLANLIAVGETNQVKFCKNVQYVK